tara:strand:- start:1816 stop:2328 length:513 start_codon:yes stop_codon:yes gene_type:complete
MKNNWLVPIVIAALAGCQANEDSLDGFITQVEQKARQDVVDLKPVLDFEVSHYQSHQQREPFVLPQAALVLNQPIVKADCWQPNERQKTGQLERFPLSKLRLKGVMGSGGRVSALVQTPEGNVVKVNSGQYIGLNNGKVAYVAESYLKINETLPDGLGCWNKRSVKLALK